MGVRGPEIVDRSGTGLSKRWIHQHRVVALAHRFDEPDRVAGLGGEQALGGGRGGISAACCRAASTSASTSPNASGTMPAAKRSFLRFVSGELPLDLVSQPLLDLQKGAQNGCLGKRILDRLHKVRGPWQARESCSHESVPSGKARAVITFGRGSGAAAMPARPEDDRGGGDLGAPRVDVDPPQGRDDSGRGLSRLNPLQLPSALEHVVAAEQEVPRAAGRVEHLHVVERSGRRARQAGRQAKVSELVSGERIADSTRRRPSVLWTRKSTT